MILESIRRPVTITMVYVAIAVLGAVSWMNVPIELLPDADLPRLTVNAEWPGSSPEVTEAFLTAPLESAIQQVRGVEKITSVSQEGQASIEVWFERDTDMDFARLELSERIASIEEEMPLGSRAPVVRPYIPEELSDQNRPFLAYTVTGPYSLEALRQYAEDELAPEISQVTGVGEVNAWGGRDRLLELELDEKKILALGLEVEDIRTRVLAMEFVREAGSVQTNSGALRTLAIRERPESAAEVRMLPLLVDQGRVVRIGDVAAIHDTYEDARSYYRVDGFPAVAFTITRAPRSNAVEVADAVKSRIAEMTPGMWSGVRLLLDDDQSKEIRTQLADLRLRAIVSAVIVLVVLLVFLASIRAAVIVFATVAFSILITLNFIYFAGLTLNLLTLMGLAMGFGLVVDNAIVVLENIYRLRKQGLSPMEAARRGAREVVLPILAATGTTVVVVVPFVYLQGELRVFYVPLAIVVGVSLVASLVVAFTFIPALGAALLDRIPVDDRRTTAGREPVVTRAYAGLIRGTLRWPWATLLVCVLALGGSYFLFSKYVSRGVLWGWGGEGDTYIAINIRQPRGEELDRTDELARYFEQRLREMPEVERFVTQVMPQTASMRVTFPDSLENTDIPVAIKEQLVQYSLLFGGAEVRVYGYGPSFYGGGSSPPNYSITIFGYNYERAREIAEDLGQRLQRYSRIRDVDTNSAGGWFNRDRAVELVLTLDRTRLGLHDLSAQDVVYQVRAAVAGQTQPGTVRVGGEELQFAVKLEGFRDMDMVKLTDLLIPTASGQTVRLGDVATLQERNVLNRVVRENQQYKRVVSYEFRGPAKLGDRVRDAVIAATDLPPGYTIQGQQEWAWSADEKEQVYGVLLVAIALIFMVTAALFESVRQPLCVLLSVPMALIGVFLVFFYTGASFTREAYIGVIMMSGIVVNNAILLIDHINNLRRAHGVPLAEATVRGAIERVRPILMTSATTVFGLLPLVLLSGANDNIWNALTYALIGGLSSSTVLVLTVTPVLYLLFERGAERRAARRAAGALASPPLVAAET